ncbi:hypothetical protein [Mycobacterium sp.]|uniref:hypothetical protein n=1 Tax=Mycobacterium sp. TaxID=1785 RepID=UPI0031DF8382
MTKEEVLELFNKNPTFNHLYKLFGLKGLVNTITMQRAMTSNVEMLPLHIIMKNGISYFKNDEVNKLGIAYIYDLKNIPVEIINE